MPGRKNIPNKLKLVKGTVQPCRETTITPKRRNDKGSYIKMRKGVMNKTAQKQWQLIALLSVVAHHVKLVLGKGKDPY